MALDLSAIAFKVNTDELEIAAKKIEALGTSVTALASTLSKVDKETARAAKTQADANLTNAKAEVILAKKNLELEKAALVQAKTNTETAKAEAIADRVAKANERHTEATERVTKATRERQSIEERQEAITRKMSEGFSRGQSSILATAEAYGEATDRIGELLKTQRAMQGTDAFDRSLGAATVFANELRVMTVANDLYAKGLGFTHNQLRELGREHVRLTEQFKVQGKDLNNLEAEFNDIVIAAKKVTDAENAMAASMKQSDKASNDAGKANAFLAREMQRVDSVLTGFNDNLNVTSSNRLLKFREQLKLSGVDAVTAEKMLKTYEERLKTINQVSQTKAKNSREEELKYLARATSVQLGDIGISLAGGQNPLLVLIQQGDQLRGVLNQVGASGGEMQKALSMAFSQIVVGSKDVVVALGSFVAGAFVDAGKSITDFAADALGVKTAFQTFKDDMFTKWASEGQAGFDKISKAMAAMQFATSALGIGIGALIALAASIGVALYQVTNANDTLTRSLIATGAQLGFTTEYAHSLAGALTGMGATRVDVLNAFTEITNSGKITSESFLQVAEAALAIERVGGPAVKETVKLMDDLRDKSVETLSKYAEQTGLVTVAQIAQVRALEEDGKEKEANTLATDLLTNAIKDQATITYASLSPMAQLWITMKDGINNAWGALQNFATSDTLLDPLTFAFKGLLASTVATAYALSSLIRIGAAVSAWATSGATMSDIVAVEKERLNDLKDTFAKIFQTGKYSQESLKAEAQLIANNTKATSEEAKAARERFEVEKKIMEDADKNSAKVLTRQEFINKAVLDYNKALGQGNTLSKEMLAIAEKNAGIEWDKAQKKPTKPKVTDAEKGLEIYIDTLNKAEGVTAKFNNELELLQASRNSIDPKFAITEEQYVKAVTELVKQQPFYIKGQKDIADQKEYEIKLIKDQLKYQEELSKIEADNAKFLLGSEADVRKMNSSYELRLELLGKTEEQQIKIKEQAELENKLAETNVKFEAQRLKIKQEFDKLANNPKNNLVEIPWVEAEAEAYRKLDEQRRKELIAIHGEVAVKAAEKFAEEFKKISNVLSDAITTALFDGGQAGTKKLKDYITSVFRNAINVQINASVSGFMGGLTGGSGTAAGVGGAGNMLSTAGGISSLFGQGSKLSFIGDAFTGVSAAMTSFGNAALATTQSLVGLSGTSAQMATSLAKAGYAGTSSIGATLGTVAPYVLAAVVVAQLLKEKEWETKVGGVFAYDPSKGTTAASVDKRYGNATGGEVPKQFMQQLLVDTTGYINGMFKSLGSKAQVSYLTGGAESSQEGEAYSFAGGKFSSGGTFGNLNQTGNNLGNANPEQIVKAFALDLQKATLSALQAAADLPKSVQEAFKDVDIQGLSEEALTKLSTSISTMITETNSLRAALEVLPFKSIDNLSFDAAQNLIKFSGGIQNLTNNLSGYYENFYSAEEKRKQTIQNITKALNAASGQDGPSQYYVSEDLIANATREQFRTTLEGIDTGTEAGLRMHAAMLSVQDAFAGITLSADELIEKEKERLDKLLELEDKRSESAFDWQQKIDVLTGKLTDNQAELANALRAVDEPLTDLDDPLKALITNFYELKPAIEAAKKLVESFKTQIQNSYDAAIKLTDDTFNAVTKIAEESIKNLNLDKKTKATDEALATVERAIELEKSKNDLILKNAKETEALSEKAVKDLTSIFELISETVQELRIEVTSTALMQMKVARQLIQSAIVSGVLPDQKDLGNAINAVRTGIKEANYATKTDKDRALLTFANELEKLASVTKPQLTAAEQALENSKKQIETSEEANRTLDSQLIQARAMVNAIRGVDSSVKTVAKAMEDLGIAVTDESSTSVLVKAIEEQVKSAKDIYDAFRSGLTFGSLTEAITALKDAMVKETAAREANKIINPPTAPAVTPFSASEFNIVKTLATERAVAKGTTPEEELYKYAKGEGYTDEMIDVKMGWPVGTAKYWAAKQQTTTPATPTKPTTPTSPVVDTPVITGPPQVTPWTDDEKLIVRNIADQWAKANGTTPEMELAKYAVSQGFTSSMTDQKMGWPIGTALHYALTNGLPAFASGINNVPYDMMAQIHEGEAIVPKKYNPFNPEARVQGTFGGTSNDNTDLVQELQALRQEVVMLRAETRATAINTSKIAKQQDRTIESDVVKVQIITP